MRLTIFIIASMLSMNVTAAPLQHTDVRLYRPFESAPLQTMLKLSSAVTGNCAHPSQIDSREDAWRCEVNQQTYDPCFVKKYVEKQQLICPQAPWSSKAVVIHVPHAMPEDNGKQLDMSTHLPWALQLVDGTQCQRYSHERAYLCQNGGSLMGEIQRCKAIWKVFYKADTKTPVKLMEIATAWF